MTSQLPKSFIKDETNQLLQAPAANSNNGLYGAIPSRVEPDPQPYGNRSRNLAWFDDMSVRKKQLAGLFTSEVISVVGLMGVGTVLIVSGGRAQLVNQAKSELAVNDIAYNIKINQMGFGFRGQADNAAVIDAALEAAAGDAVPPETLAQVETILQNEIQARNIEYATLVGPDRRIIASANANRVGEEFDPEGLVSSVLANPRQVKTSAVVSWEELQKENPPLPEGFSGQAALIRYTFTPVIDFDSSEVIGVLISGDIVNNKSAIAQSTLEAFDNGYSAVYMRQADGTFTLASSLDMAGAANVQQASVNVALPDASILEWAAEADGAIVTDRTELGENGYTLAAKAISSTNGEPVAVIVRGTSEAALNALLSNSLKIQLVIAAIALAADVLLAMLLGRSIASPLMRLKALTLQYARGDRSVRAPVHASDEVGQLSATFNELADQIEMRENTLITERQRQTQAAERSRLLADLTLRIRRTLDFDTILTTSVEGIREVLRVDRALVYRFNPDYKSGYVSSESVAQGYKRAKGQIIEDPLTPEALDRYYSGTVSVRENVNRDEMSHCHCDILDDLGVKANMVAPILVGDDLIGLLCVHACSAPRTWEDGEKDLLQQVSTQIGYALRQAQFLEQQEAAANQERLLNEIVSEMRSFLDRERIFRTIVTQTRRALQSDRVGVYLFNPDWSGRFVAEAVDPAYPTALNAEINDPCFADKYVEKYRQGRVQATPNIHEAGLTECHLQQLEPFEVKANIVAPILADDKLIGLLIAHQCSAPRTWIDEEIGLFRQLALQLGFALEQADLFAQREAAQRAAELLGERERTLNDIVSDMRKFLEPDKIYSTVVTKTRSALESDRVGVYLFDDDWAGTFVAEAVDTDYPSALGATIADPCFADEYVDKYRQGRVKATDNIDEAGLTECHLNQLKPFEVKANLVAPILVDEKLVGLLITHQCSGPRLWTEDEISFFRQIAQQVGFAVEQAQLFVQKAQAQQETEALYAEQQQRAEALQRQLVSLLGEVEGAVEGDLTVRAEVTADEIGIVADFFNSIVESLRQVVVNVKDAASQVNLSLGENRSAIGDLAEAALKQAEDTTRTLDSVEQMTESIQAVASNAQQAAIVARQASDTAASGEAAIDSTVENILSLRDTVSETAKKVKRLGESSQQISKVVSLINQIALQTNLLAINAGIEAARAGEEGQGFAVVAEEVGELAARSATATQEIEKIVETIQLETSQVVSAMEESTAQVVEGTQLVEGAKHSLSQILQVSQQIDQLVQSISAATVSQAETSEAVSQLMRQVVSVSEQTSSSSRQVSLSIQETVNVAQELQVSVGTFKVGT
ncbi:MAG: GAF domain-containing protein [Cyanobacteria bacterium P01_A01_bin.135]